MKISELQNQYQEAAKTEDYSVHNQFIKNLLASQAQGILQFHFDLLKNAANQKLYQRVRAVFAKRGEGAKTFLINKVEHESEPRQKGDAIQILGHLRAQEVLPLVRQCLSQGDDYLRYNAIIVLGWLGSLEDVDLLGARIMVEPDPLLRGYVATAMRQIFLRKPESQNVILSWLRLVIEREESALALELMIVAAQTISKKYFGLRENINEGTISGDIQQARTKALQFFAA